MDEVRDETMIPYGATGRIVGGQQHYFAEPTVFRKKGIYNKQLEQDSMLVTVGAR